LEPAHRWKLFTPGELCSVGGCPSLGPLEQTAFTAAFGGGVDVKATRFLWIRVIQADYLREYFSGDTQNNVPLVRRRLSVRTMREGLNPSAAYGPPSDASRSAPLRAPVLKVANKQGSAGLSGGSAAFVLPII